jgi:hypothetical protein
VGTEHNKATMANEKTEKKRARARKKFLHFFRGGFYSQKYLDWERDYKWNAHLTWQDELNEKEYTKLMKSGNFGEIAKRATRLESRTNLLFSFEKMALRDAVKSAQGAELFARGLYDYVYGGGTLKRRFESFTETLTLLPRKQTRVRTWPLQTVFGFIANPHEHIFLKPRVTQEAADVYGFDFKYDSAPNWETYKSLLDFAQQVKTDNKDLKPRDYIDLQSFIWVLGSAEYDL